MEENIFRKIIRGEAPCHRIYEDDRVLAFLDIFPISRGHTLLIPKEPVVTIAELSEESAAAIGRILPRLCRAILAATGARDYNILQNNGAPAHQVVPHVHFHIIPKYPDGSGLGIGWKSSALDQRNGFELTTEIVARLG